MEVIDIHVHLTDKAAVADVEKFLDGCGLTAMVLISRGAEGDDTRRAIEELAEIKHKLGERIFPFARIDPTQKDSPAVLEWAVRECGMVGLKMLPSNFNPNHECARAMYEAAGRLGIPMLMHTGILWIAGNNANDCRPGNMEVMWDYPQVRFAMAHIGWPWTDECIAVAQKLNRMRPVLDQAFVDLTPGTPKSYREPAFAKCLENVHADHMLYGSDGMIPRRDIPTGRWQGDKEILDRLAVSEKDQQMIFAGNARRFLTRARGEAVT